MKTAEGLIDQLTSRGVSLSEWRGRLRYDGEVSDAEIAELVRHKAELLALLEKRRQAVAKPSQPVDGRNLAAAESPKAMPVTIVASPPVSRATLAGPASNHTKPANAASDQVHRRRKTAARQPKPGRFVRETPPVSSGGEGSPNEPALKNSVLSLFERIMWG